MELIFAYITGSIMIVLAFLTFVFKSRKTTLLLKTSIDFIGIINLVFILLATNNLAILAGIVTTAIAFIRDIVYSLRNKYKLFNHFAWPLIFCLIFACSLFFTYKSVISILPMIGSLFSTATLYANNQKITKTGALVCAIMNVIYYSILIPTSDFLTIFPLISNSAGLIGTIIGLFVLFSAEKVSEN